MLDTVVDIDAAATGFNLAQAPCRNVPLHRLQPLCQLRVGEPFLLANASDVSGDRRPRRSQRVQRFPLVFITSSHTRQLKRGKSSFQRWD